MSVKEYTVVEEKPEERSAQGARSRDRERQTERDKKGAQKRVEKSNTRRVQ